MRDRLVPWFMPSCMVLKARLRDGRRCTAADLSAAALVEGGWFTPARLHAIGLRPDPICRLCGRKVGTLWHRMGACESTAVPRAAVGGCPSWLIKKGIASLWDPLFSRGVPALPKIPPPPPEVSRWGLSGRPDTPLATGDVYTDGALSGRWRRIMRAGWGVVALASDSDRAEWALYGTMSEVNPSIIRAELRAVLEALRIAMPPLRLHVDNAEVVQGWNGTKEWCTDPSRDGADLWRAIWHLREEIGEGVQVLKVKAHTEEEEVAAGRISDRNR